MKKVILSSDILKPALTKLGQAVHDKPETPALENILMKVKPGQVEMITSDLELTISMTLEAETEGEFDVLIPFKMLRDVVSLIKSAPVVIEHPSTRKARILGDNDVHELNSLHKLEEYPAHPSVPRKNALTLPAGFVALLDRAMLTVSKDVNQVNLAMACLDIETSEVNIVSTDANYLFRHSINTTGAADMTEQLLISKKTATALVGMQEIELTWSAKQMAFKSDKMIIWSRRHEHKFPNYKKVVPDFPVNLQVQRSVLALALRKACLSSLETKATTVSLAPKEMTLTIDDPKYARKIVVKIPVDYSGAVESLTISAARLLTMMSQIDAADISLHVGPSASKPILVTATDDAGYLGLLLTLQS